MADLIHELKTARAERRTARLTPAELPTDPNAAYALVLADPAPVAAWKIGGANPWSRKVFANEEVFFGALHIDELSMETGMLAVGGLHAPLAEPEIMLEIADPRTDNPTAAFARMGLGFEIPASVLPETCKTRLTGQILDRAGAGALWVSALQPFDAARLTAPFASEFRHNNTAPMVGHSTDVLGGPLEAAMEFLRLARRHGAALAPAQWVATGGLNPAVPIEPGDRLSFTALGIEVFVKLM